MSKPNNCTCGRRKAQNWHLACPQCWALVPVPLQTKVYHFYKTARGGDEHVAAVRDCYAAIHAARPQRAGVPALPSKP